MSPGAWYQPQISLQIYQGEDKQHSAADGLKRKIQQLVNLKHLIYDFLFLETGGAEVL